MRLVLVPGDLPGQVLRQRILHAVGQQVEEGLQVLARVVSRAAVLAPAVGQGVRADPVGVPDALALEEG